jgi:hypothetical protein
VRNLPPGRYIIRVEELYLQESDPILQDVVDLEAEPVGEICAERTYDPWHAPPPPAIVVTDFSGCKQFGDPVDSVGPPPDRSCLTWEYIGRGRIRFSHLNAVFNCCPDVLTATINLEDDTITIVEGETLRQGGCDCICSFDVHYTATGIRPGVYTIRVVELYMHPQHRPLIFTVDLAASPSGSFCIDRPFNPGPL